MQEETELQKIDKELAEVFDKLSVVLDEANLLVAKRMNTDLLKNTK